jgi:hypothetical protein
MPQETKAKFGHDLDQHDLQGTRAVATEREAFERAVELAVDYRGDVTITTSDTGEQIECYVFDVKRTDSPDTTFLRYIARNEDRRSSIPFSRINEIEFTGRDTAAGKSFETWMKKYVEKKLAGERASIESDPLMD